MSMSHELEELHKGKTLQIYWYLLTHREGSAGIRAFQGKIEWVKALNNFAILLSALLGKY